MTTNAQTVDRPRTTFAVADVRPATAVLPDVPYRDAVEAALGTRVESCPSRLHTRLVPAPYHPFVHAVHLAYDGHRPLALSPDHVWVLVCQGVAAHVNANAEALRRRLVDFDGKRTIEVRRDGFVKGSMEDPWEDVFPEFADKLRGHVGAAAKLFTPGFSTTGPVEAAACHVTLMDAVQAYFNYGMYSACGIPAITLEGTPADWALLRDRAQAFRAFDLAWWIDPLTSVLDQFCAAARRRVDTAWWRSFYKWNGGSGGPYVNGHVLKFFPYLTDHETRAATRRNHLLGRDDIGNHGVTMPRFPSGQSTAPVEWRVGRGVAERRHAMEFVGGFVGVTQRSDTTLRPEVGWAVREQGAARASGAGAGPGNRVGL